MHIAAKHGKSPAQVCIRWSMQNQVPAIPKSTTEWRTRENAHVFDFVLDADDMFVLDNLHDEVRKVVRWDDLQHRFDLPDGYKLRTRATSCLLLP